jgi:hypothetical protein
MEVTERRDGVTVVNDAYNANPESMRAALKALAVMSAGQEPPQPSPSSATWPSSATTPARRTRPGPLPRAARHRPARRRRRAGGGIHAGAVLEGTWGGESVHVPDVDAAVALLREELRPGDVVLVRPHVPRAWSASLRRCWRPPVRISSRGAPAVRSVLIAAMTALIVSLLCTPAVVRLFRRRGYGQEIREDGPSSHATKRGTPTMGGAVIIAATLIGYAVAHLAVINQPGRGPTASGLLVLGLMTGLGLVGFLDDIIKIRKQRSLGLNAASKFIGQFVVGVGFAVAALQFKNDAGLTPASTQLSFVRDYAAIGLGTVGFVIFAY